jgi:ureidoglycolate lyase
MRAYLQELTPEAFAPYGQVLHAPDNGSRQNFVARVENNRPTLARANMALVTAAPAPFPLEIKALERHAHSNQSFIPLSIGEYLVVVCNDTGEGRPDLKTLKAFRVSGDTGVNYDASTWHYGMTAIGEPGTFAMLVHESGSADDCEFVDIEPLVVSY